eukprot:4017174-Prymnesium_polylepis.3
MVIPCLYQASPAFRQAMYNYKQSRWYKIPLIVLYSKANYNPNVQGCFMFTQPSVPMPMMSKVIEAG